MENWRKNHSHYLPSSLVPPSILGNGKIKSKRPWHIQSLPWVIPSAVRNTINISKQISKAIHIGQGAEAEEEEHGRCLVATSRYMSWWAHVNTSLAGLLRKLQRELCKGNGTDILHSTDKGMNCYNLGIKHKCNFILCDLTGWWI